ncbi:MAG: hypothetical protein HDR36_01985 [Treponema sp.]|nr:hypothetical protein [Treponema sp.]
MKKTTFLRKLNFLVALGGVFAAAAFYGCGNLFSSIDSASDSPANLAQPREGYGIVSGSLPSSDSASARTAMPSKPDETALSFKVFAQSGSQKIEANVNDADRTFSLSLPFGTWEITANGMVADGRILFTQTQTVTLSEENATAFLQFELGYSTNPDDGDGEISLSVSFPPKGEKSAIRGIEYVLSRGEEKIVQNVGDADLGVGKFKIGLATENLGAWHLTILFYGDFSNLVYRIDQTVNVYANLTTDTFEGSAPYISGGAIAVTQALLEDFQNTTLYVNATSGKDTNTGTQFDPLQTFNRALELVNNSTRDASTEFRIFLQTDVADGAMLELKIGKKLTVASASADGTPRTITSLGRTFIVPATSELTVQSVAFEKLRFDVSGTFTMDGGEISGNTAENGGAICINAGGKATIANTKIHDNSASNKGGGVYVGGSANATLTNCAIKSCETTVTAAGNGGGGIYSLGTLTVTGGTISDCIAGRSGGGIYAYGGTVECSDGVAFSGCEATGSGNVGSGGGICINKDVTVDVSDCTFVSCTANASGGGIWNAGELDVSNTSFTTCSANNNGGGVCNDGGTVTMSGTAKITGNNASGGGGVAVNSGTFTLENGTISNNTANNGGGVYVDGDSSASSSFTMKDGTISDNTADGSKGSGGGVYVYNGTFTMEGGEISDNTAKGVDGESFGGGGIYLYRMTTSMPGGTFTLKGGTVSGNEAEYGGGIWASSFSEFTMEGGTFSGNKSTENGNGAYVNPGCTFTMSGVAQFAKDDDVYLYDSNQSLFATITVAGTLTAASPVATITPSAYELDRQVLSKGGNVAETMQDICAQFALTPNPDEPDAEWNIMPDSTGANGVLKTKMDIYVRGVGEGWYEENPAFTASTGSDTTGNGSKTKPFATIQKAIEKIIGMNDGADAYTIYIDGTLYGMTAAKLGDNGMADFSALDKNLTLTIKALSETTNATLAGGAQFNADGTVTANGIKKSIIYAKPAGGALNLTLENLVIKSGYTTVNGGGIYIEGGNTTLTMNGGTIENNKAEKGGGVYVNSSTFIMNGTAKISGNNASGDGGGVALNGGTFTMNDGTISNNTAAYGAGIHVNGGGKVTMTGGKISGNTATGKDDSGGGGIHLFNGTFEMSGGTVTGNEAKGTAEGAGGGGMYIYHRNTNTFTMTGGSFSGNTAQRGKGAFVCKKDGSTGTLSMSGSAKFAESDDVYLYDAAPNTEPAPTITVAGGLTAASPVATITPSAYTAGRQVLSKGGSVTEITQDICGKFAVTYQYGTNWIIVPNDTRANGVLTTTNTVYLNASSGDDANLGLTASKAVKTLSKAIELYDTYPSKKIMVCAEYTLANGENTLLDRAGAGKRTLTLVRYDGSSDVSGNFTGNLLTISQGDVTITNVTLDGNKENVAATGSLLYIEGSTTVVTLGNGATICNNETNGNGGGVYVDDGTFEMSGTISGCTANSGGGIYNSADGTLIMKGGKISNNNVEGFGGGIYNTGVATISGGTIASCKVTGHGSNYGGGGICSTRRLTVISGIIKNCNARYNRGGGVQVFSGTFEMSGGEISDNVGYYGGGVCVAHSGTSIFTMTGGKIIGNEAWGQGGGVYVGDKFTMSDGEISGNTAQDGGDGVYESLVGTFTHTGGTVQAD